MKKEIFQNICSQVFSSLQDDEQLTIYLEGENSQYFLFNDSKLRQSGIIEDYAVTISLFFWQEIIAICNYSIIRH